MDCPTTQWGIFFFKAGVFRKFPWSDHHGKNIP